MEDILLDIGNNSREILPVPYPRSPTPSVPNPVNYGSSPHAMSIKLPESRVNDNLQYCNFLEPSPRNQQLNVPYEGEKNCPNFKTQPYGKDSCYLMDSKAQGVVGIVCNQPGGSDNANFYRGNQFGLDYPLDQNLENKKLEYTVEQPVQLPLELENPMMYYDKQTFNPEPSFLLRKNKDFITYPLQQNYTEYGSPTYVYPYKTMNPFTNELMKEEIKETFENMSIKNNNSTNKKNFIMILIIIIILYFFIFM